MHNKEAQPTTYSSLTLTHNLHLQPIEIHATSAIHQQTLQGNIAFKNLTTGQQQVLTSKEGDFENIQAVLLNETSYIVYTAYQNRKKAIFLLSFNNHGKISQFQLTEWGKFDHPTICEHQNNLMIFWENFTDKNCQIDYTTFSPDSNLLFQPDRFSATETSERSYRPKAISDGRTLYLVYESFFENRYHLMLRLLTAQSDHFENTVEIGFDTLNDLSPSLWNHNGNILVTWENTSPLTTEYVWKDPAGTDVTMPAFGHGWQVLSKMGLRSLAFDGEKLSIASLSTNQNWNKPLELHNPESAGEPVIFQINDVPLIAYVSKASQTHYWQMELKAYQNDHWTPIEIPEILYDYRQKPILTLIKDRLFVAGITLDNGGKENTIFEIDLSAQKSSKPPAWPVSKVISPAQITATPYYQDEPRQTIEVNGETLQVFWGDLHMHSNLSICSLHPKFHCTELPIKHRFSQDVGRLDFNLLTDHQTMDDIEWIQTVKYAHLHHNDHTSVCFAGFEWTSTGLKDFHNYGHYNVLFQDEGPLMRIRTGEFDTVEKVWQQLKQTPGLTIPHHPGEKVHPLDWEAFDTQTVPLVELFQVRGSYESDHCEMHPENYGRRIKPGNSIQTGLNMGYRFGFTCGGEHEGVGITAVFAHELTREAIYEALQKRQVYGTTHAKIFLDFRINNALMGSEIELDGDEILDFSVEVRGTDQIESLHLVSSQGEICLLNQPGQNHLSHHWQQTFTRESDWFYIRVKQSDGNLAWSSPVWVDQK